MNNFTSSKRPFSHAHIIGVPVGYFVLYAKCKSAPCSSKYALISLRSLSSSMIDKAVPVVRVSAKAAPVFLIFKLDSPFLSMYTSFIHIMACNE